MSIKLAIEKGLMKADREKLDAIFELSTVKEKLDYFFEPSEYVVLINECNNFIKDITNEILNELSLIIKKQRKWKDSDEVILLDQIIDIHSDKLPDKSKLIARLKNQKFTINQLFDIHKILVQDAEWY